ncbi:centrosomal protein 20-like isoform X2 [Frankliniella occidentalis]|uniref:Centrosomal protein 20-like isoform X2 n=1 Tax=Frankliniella occidentalis TaxID=133901 RepID=A0A6J1TD55_FRAOC|nr:centrosomal protein 20-like isoform X2 [Frankliniella occidentalis]
MARSQDLAQAMRTALEENGDLIELQAQIEEEMLEALTRLQSGSNEHNSQYSFSTKRCKPAMPPEIILANNLIRQYLEEVGLKRTSSVLCTESGLPQSAVPDTVLRTAFPSLHSSGANYVVAGLYYAV